SQLPKLLAARGSVAVEPQCVVENGHALRLQRSKVTVNHERDVRPLCHAAIASQLVELLATEGSLAVEPQRTVEKRQILRPYADSGGTTNPATDVRPLGHASIASQLE